MNRDFLDAVSESVRISQQKWLEWQHKMKGIIHYGPCLALGTNQSHPFMINVIVLQ